jgi:hypothetical protein
MTWGGHVAPQDAVACSLTELHFIACCFQVLVKGLMPALPWTEEVAGASSGASPWVSHHWASPKQALVYPLAGGSRMSTLILYLRSLQHPVVNGYFHALRSIYTASLTVRLVFCAVLCWLGCFRVWIWTWRPHLQIYLKLNGRSFPLRMVASASLSVALCRFPLCWGMAIAGSSPFSDICVALHSFGFVTGMLRTQVPLFCTWH